MLLSHSEECRQFGWGGRGRGGVCHYSRRDRNITLPLLMSVTSGSCVSYRMMADNLIQYSVNDIKITRIAVLSRLNFSGLKNVEQVKLIRGMLLQMHNS